MLKFSAVFLLVLLKVIYTLFFNYTDGNFISFLVYFYYIFISSNHHKNKNTVIFDHDHNIFMI